MSVSTNDLKNGMTLELDGTLFQVVEFQHVKPGKGGAFVRTKLRNVKTGSVVERTFNAGVKVGLEIHEAPSLRWDGGEELIEGMVVTIEPGVYIPGLGGVRIEDMVEVTADGRREIPRATKELMVL